MCFDAIRMAYYFGSLLYRVLNIIANVHPYKRTARIKWFQSKDKDNRQTNHTRCHNSCASPHYRCKVIIPNMPRIYKHHMLLEILGILILFKITLNLYPCICDQTTHSTLRLPTSNIVAQCNPILHIARTCKNCIQLQDLGMLYSLSVKINMYPYIWTIHINRVHNDHTPRCTTAKPTSNIKIHEWPWESNSPHFTDS